MLEMSLFDLWKLGQSCSTILERLCRDKVHLTEKIVERAELKAKERLEREIFKWDPFGTLQHVMNLTGGEMIGEYLLHAIETPLQYKDNQIVILAQYDSCRQVKRLMNLILQAIKIVQEKVSFYSDYSLKRVCHKQDGDFQYDDIMAMIKLKINRIFFQEDSEDSESGEIERKLCIDIHFIDPEIPLDYYLDDYFPNNYQRIFYNGDRIRFLSLKQLLAGRTTLTRSDATIVDEFGHLPERINYYFNMGCNLMNDKGQEIVEEPQGSYRWK